LNCTALIALRFVGTDETKFHNDSAQKERWRTTGAPHRTRFQRVGISRLYDAGKTALPHWIALSTEAKSRRVVDGM
jgi:hypothetical protein